MNVIEILWKLGWDILSFDQEGHYKICLSGRRRIRMIQEENAGISKYDGDLFGIFNVEVGEVCFNEGGNLYVAFNIVGTGELLDVYEHGSMTDNELYR